MSKTCRARNPHFSLIWLGCVTALMNALLLYLGQSKGFLDGRLFYSPDQMDSLFAWLGEGGRRLYLWNECLDLVFIVLYVSCFSQVLRFLSAKQTKPYPSYLKSLPFWMGGWDVLETVGIIILLVNHPERMPLLAQSVSLFTPLKWGTLLILLLQIIKHLKYWKNI